MFSSSKEVDLATIPTLLLRISSIFNFLQPVLYFLPKQIRSILPIINHQSSPSVKTQPRASKLTDCDRIELEKIFSTFDCNGDGRITKEELNDSLQNLGIFIPDEDLTTMINSIDIDGDGCIDVDEFIDLHSLITGDKDDDEEEEEDMKEAFQVFDVNGDGFITADELRSVLDSLRINQRSTAADCRKMIERVDGDGDGRVSYQEFREMLIKGGRLLG